MYGPQPANYWTSEIYEVSYANFVYRITDVSIYRYIQPPIRRLA